MKTLLLLRHAIAEPGSPGGADRDRPLKAAGRAAAEAMARYLAERGHAPTLVLCSSSLRTVETLDCLRRDLSDSAREQIDDSLYLASSDVMLEHLSGIEAAVSSALLIGHNPALQELACALAVAGGRGARERMARGFTPAACAVIRFDIGDWSGVSKGGRLLDFKRPGDLRL